MDLFADLFRQNLFAQMGNTVIALSFVLVRILAFMHFAPIFSHKSVPAHVRIAFSLFLTIFFIQASTFDLPEVVSVQS